MASSPGLLASKCQRIKRVRNHPGHIFVMGEVGDVFVINVLTMTVVKRFVFEFEGIAKCYH